MRGVFHDGRRQWLRKSRLTRLFLPLTIFCFRHPLARLSSTLDGGKSRWPSPNLPSQFLRLTGILRRQESTYDRELRKFVNSLNTIVAEYWLAAAEAFVRQRSLLFDEGFVQRGTTLCLLSPAALREVIWDEYLSCVPSTIECLVLQCRARHALTRTLDRGLGIPWSFSSKHSDNAGPGNAIEAYRLVSWLLAGTCVSSHLRCELVEAESEEGPLTALAEMLGTDRYLVLPRPRR